MPCAAALHTEAGGLSDPGANSSVVLVPSAPRGQAGLLLLNNEDVESLLISLKSSEVSGNSGLCLHLAYSTSLASGIFA